MRRTSLFIAVLLLAGCADRGKEARERAEKSIHYEAVSGGVYRVTFDTPYFYGDRVEFKSDVNGSGVGVIVDIVLMEDGQVYYSIEPDNSKDLQGGIYPDEITLIERPNKSVLGTR